MTERIASRVVLATRNRGKLAELRALLGRRGMQGVAVAEFDAQEVEEVAPTFVENALLKARAAARASGLAAIADDSGLEVDALNGAPGVRSARYAGAGASDEDNVRKLLQALDGVPEGERGARFRCVIVRLAHADDPSPLICDGVWPGVIARVPSGANGFGYDPVFVDPVQGVTAAEMAPSRKNEVSHRARALNLLLARMDGSQP